MPEPTATLVEPTTTFEPAAEPVAEIADSLRNSSWEFAPVGNVPVIAHSDEGWDSGRIDPGAVVWHNGRYHMFRNGFLQWPGETAIGYSVSDDGLNWQDGSDSHILTVADIAWPDIVAANVSSVHVEADGTWVLYFHSWHTRSANLGSGFIGRATAPQPDGPWTPDPEPVLRMSDDGAAWDGGQVSQATVWREEGGYKMVYTGADQNGFMRLGLAESADGMSWQKRPNPILEPDANAWDKNGTYQARIVQTPAGYVMLYKTFGSNPFSAYGIALSGDGENWEKTAVNPIILPNILPDGTSLEAPAFLYKDGVYRLYTEGFTTSRSQTDIFLLTFADETATEEAVAALTPKRQLTYAANVGGQPHGRWERANFESYVAEQPGLEGTYKSGDYYSSFVMTSIHNQLDADPPPDVVSSLLVGVLRERVEAGGIADISDLWQEQGWDDAFPASLKEWVTFDDKQYFVPLAIQWNGIFYRRDVMAEAGVAPPTTWEELLTACDTLNAAGITPFTTSVSQWPPPAGFWFTSINLRLNGPQFHEQLMRGEIAYTDERVVAVFDHWQQLFDHQCFAENSASNGYNAGITDFSSSKTAMYLHGEWLFEFIAQSVAQQTGFAPFPVINPDVAQGELVPMWGAFIPANAPNPEEARQFLAYLASQPSQLSNYEALGRTASHLGVDRNLYDEVHRQGLELIEQADALTQLYGFNTAPDVARAGYAAIASYWRNPENVDTLLLEWEAAREAEYGAVP
ncbi:MAG: extracellular solute-binding protein [Chloroflexota bacterium]